jgi:hypothetical protein
MKLILIAALLSAPASAASMSSGGTISNKPVAVCAEIKARKVYYQDLLNTTFRTEQNRTWALAKIKQADDEYFSKCYGKY